MTESNPFPPEQAYQALEKLTSRFLGHPAISLIDLGLDPQAEAGAQLALRVHIRLSAQIAALDLPTQVDGIPVRIIRADYQLE